LPKNWEEEARKQKALTRSRKIKTPEELLKLAFVHLLGCSLNETVKRSEHLNIELISTTAFFKRFKTCEAWFAKLVQEIGRDRWDSLAIRGRRILCVDATSLSKPGSKGTDYRIHYQLELSTFGCAYLEITNGKVGETFRWFPIKKGDVLIGDRVYANPAGVKHIIDQEGDVLVRLNPKSLPLYDENGKRLSVLDLVRDLEEEKTKEWETWVKPKDGPLIQGRLIAFKLNGKHANRSERRLLRKVSQKNHGKVSPECLELAGYILLWTTLGKEWTAEEICQLYRARWQIELLFKRMKSILRLDRLLKKNENSAKSWICGMLLIALLLERLIEIGNKTVPQEGDWIERRSRWKEFMYMLREFFSVIIPTGGLIETVKKWSSIAEKLAEKVRKRKYQVPALLEELS